MGYRYWLLRYVPSAVRGERINIGVVVGDSDGVDWAMRYVPSFSRANRLGGDARALMPVLNRIREATQARRHEDVVFFDDTQHRAVNDPSGYMERLRRQQKNQLGISAGRPISGSNAKQIVDYLYEFLVVEPPPRVGARTRQEAFHELSDAFHEHLPSRDLQSRVRLVAASQRTGLDFVVGRSELRMLTQVWSFQARAVDALGERLQASHYALSRLRDDGGTVRNPRRKHMNRFDVPHDIPVRVLFVPPETPQQRSVFTAASDAWADLDVSVLEAGNEQALAVEAQGLLASS